MWSGVWNPLRRYGGLIKFCSELKSDEDLKAVVNDSNQVMDELSNSHSRGERRLEAQTEMEQHSSMTLLKSWLRNNQSLYGMQP